MARRGSAYRKAGKLAGDNGENLGIYPPTSKVERYFAFSAAHLRLSMMEGTLVHNRYLMAIQSDK